jgi:phenylacetate-CoA ligase
VNIYPGQIDHVLSFIPEIGSEYQVVLNRGVDGKDTMAIRVERSAELEPARDAEIARKVGGEIKSRLLVSCEVEVVDHHALPRSERKSRRIFDNRPL